MNYLNLTQRMSGLIRIHQSDAHRELFAIACEIDDARRSLLVLYESTQGEASDAAASLAAGRDEHGYSPQRLADSIVHERSRLASLERCFVPLARALMSEGMFKALVEWQPEEP